MSLRKTLEGARSEASQSSSAKPEAAPAKKGASRRSTAKAKPTREKAASVRTVSKSSKKAAASLPGAKKTKEQKEAARAQRRKEREEEDYKNQAFQLLLNQNPKYKKTERVWWILIGIGFAATLVSLAVTFVSPTTGDGGVSTRDIVSVVSLVVAYAFIISSFVFDWIARRPIRKETEKKLQGMSQKKIAELFARERKAELERKAAKEAAKKGKK